MEKYHNQRAKLRRFNLDDMVLRKVSQATRDPNSREVRTYLGGSLQGHPLL